MQMFSIMIYMSVYIRILIYHIYLSYSYMSKFISLYAYIYVKYIYICQIHQCLCLRFVHLTIYKLYINKGIFTFLKAK